MKRFFILLFILICQFSFAGPISIKQDKTESGGIFSEVFYSVENKTEYTWAKGVLTDFFEEIYTNDFYISEFEVFYKDNADYDIFDIMMQKKEGYLYFQKNNDIYFFDWNTESYFRIKLSKKVDNK